MRNLLYFNDRLMRSRALGCGLVALETAIVLGMLVYRLLELIERSGIALLCVFVVAVSVVCGLSVAFEDRT